MGLCGNLSKHTPAPVSISARWLVLEFISHLQYDCLTSYNLRYTCLKGHLTVINTHYIWLWKSVHVLFDPVHGEADFTLKQVVVLYFLLQDYVWNEILAPVCTVTRMKVVLVSRKHPLITWRLGSVLSWKWALCWIFTGEIHYVIPKTELISFQQLVYLPKLESCFSHAKCYKWWSYFSKQDVVKNKLHTQLSSTDLFGDDEELSSDDEQVSRT